MKFDECDVLIRETEVGDVRNLFPLSNAIAIIEIDGQDRAFLVEGSSIINRYKFRWGGIFENGAYDAIKKRSSNGITINFPDVTLKSYAEKVKKATKYGGKSLDEEPIFRSQFNGCGTPFLQKTPDCLEGVIEDVWEIYGNGFANVLITGYHSDETISAREGAILKLVWDSYGSLDEKALNHIENPVDFRGRMNPEWVEDGIIFPYKVMGVPTGPEAPAQWPANANPTVLVITVYDRNNQESNIIPCTGVAFMGDGEQGSFIGVAFAKNAPSGKQYNDRYWERYSTKLVLREKEMGVNVPCIGMENAVEAVGRNSYRKVGSKWKMLNGYWTPRSSKIIKAELIAQCYIGFECKVETIKELGSHYWVIGKVVQVHVDKSIENGESKVYWNPLTQVCRL